MGYIYIHNYCNEDPNLIQRVSSMNNISIAIYKHEEYLNYIYNLPHQMESKVCRSNSYSIPPLGHESEKDHVQNQ